MGFYSDCMQVDFLFQFGLNYTPTLPTSIKLQPSRNNTAAIVKTVPLLWHVSCTVLVWMTLLAKSTIWNVNLKRSLIFFVFGMFNSLADIVLNNNHPCEAVLARNFNFPSHRDALKRGSQRLFSCNLPEVLYKRINGGFGNLNQMDSTSKMLRTNANLSLLQCFISA